MSVSEHGGAGIEVLPELDFQRTVDRSLVHRASIAEVFVVDSSVLGARRCVVGAQLPLTHGYYGDHSAGPTRLDPLLLLECCRQAAIYGSHWLVGLRLGAAMIVKSFSLRLDDPDGTLSGARPGELVLDTSYQGQETKRGRVRNAGVVQELFLGGAHIGTHEMSLTILRESENQALRSVGRGTPPPSTADYEGLFDGERAAPSQVGRRDPRNVVLADVRRTPGGAAATVAPDFGNRSLFDHDYDHLPAMVLAEAARQLAVAALDDGTGAQVDRHPIVGLTAAFERYAELDDRLTATATVTDRPDGGRRVAVTFTHGDATAAEICIETRPTTGE